MQVIIIRSTVENCEECKGRPSRYGLALGQSNRFIELCPQCFGELLRKAVAVASEMV